MTFDEAQTAAKSGRKMMLPHWCWVYVSRGERGGVVLFEEDGEARGAFKPTKAERASNDWVDYPTPKLAGEAA